MSPLTPKAPGVAPVARALDLVLRPVCWLAFWLAIVLPGLYLPLLAVGRTDLGLAGVCLHALAVVLGQGHDGRR
jgi:hypothetical protein